MSKAKAKESTLEEKIRWLLEYDHDITIDSGCSFGDHWQCSCGETGLDSPSSHLADKIVELVNSGIEKSKNL
jgi:hypothetical protein